MLFVLNCIKEIIKYNTDVALCCSSRSSAVAAAAVTDLQNVVDSIQTKQLKFTAEWEREAR